MAARFVSIPGLEELRKFVEASIDMPSIVYLHDPYCPVSAGALREVSLLDAEVALIDVHRNPKVSVEVERMTGIRHESPQVIIFQDGAARWSASHRRVTEHAITRALAAVNGVQAGPPPSGEATQSGARDFWAKLLGRRAPG